jgi:hypothetical protein
MCRKEYQKRSYSKMTEKSKPRRLSETVIPGQDYAAKIKIKDILGQDVVITSFEKVMGSPEFSIVDEETGEVISRDYWREVISRDYWNVEVEADGKTFTFSTGAVPINKVLTALQAKIDNGEADLPLLATFSKEGRTYVVS